jgi:hypothetical protein
MSHRLVPKQLQCASPAAAVLTELPPLRTQHRLLLLLLLSFFAALAACRLWLAAAAAALS